jgi:DNA mismatch repair ATPase MutS
MKYFFELYEDKAINETFLYSFGFNSYIDCLEGLQQNIQERKINFTEFTDNNKKIAIKNNYYACLKDSTPVKNDIKFKKNIIITGPNASGKTTILKSTLINILLSQQFGCGFYDSATIHPFHHIHCYLNIPDTSGRDSLFQAEARRCKEILDTIDNNKKDNHFCVFDELYSGTNPDEAISSAKSFMEYIVKNKNVSCMLTTHFVKVCKKLKKNENIINYHMETEKKNQRLNYKYKLKMGISEIKGGFSVLTEMNYPKEILDNTHCK